ncbi:hypothetical protein GCM10027275_48090 [Rhabdobacter roseus]|uniref:Heme/copper-type cytochrome/quinol oxidase subunit 2 n=1 Tax=Rhabdobacter roseus TaxID=1655419 RepID=A0A840U450_9BACT|nr:hypothetical protein [Rhabdobacter roseus]MBB5286870.1 heme/copper-type cytochrome/quinol oxidase subunit 2 [Rhabdobacter roseus]
MKYLLLQIPQEVPNQTEPVDFTSMTSIVVYLGVPVLLLGFYIFWRKRLARIHREEQEREMQENARSTDRPDESHG